MGYDKAIKNFEEKIKKAEEFFKTKNYLKAIGLLVPLQEELRKFESFYTKNFEKLTNEEREEDMDLLEKDNIVSDYISNLEKMAKTNEVLMDKLNEEYFKIFKKK